MAKVNFPNNPSDGDTFSSGGTTYTYNTAKGYWDGNTSTPGDALTISLEADVTDGELLVLDSDQWVNKTADEIGLAPVESPVFTGSPVAVTPIDASNSTRIATTAFVQSLIAGLSEGGGSGGGSGVSVVASAVNLPAGADAGTLAYTTDTNKMFCFNGTAWILVFTATSPNASPNLVTGPKGRYLLAVDGTPTVITLAAQDPEGVVLSWSYAITDGVLGNTATISQADNVLTITPSTDTANSGSFEITISISDGVNVVNAPTLIRLTFALQDFSYGLVHKSMVPMPPGLGTGTELYFGHSAAAHEGKLAVASREIVADGTTGADNVIHIYNTLDIETPVYEATITKPANATDFVASTNGLGGRTIQIFQDMVVALGETTGDKIGVFVFYKINDVWTQTQTLEAIAPWTYPWFMPHKMPLQISDNGLVMVWGQSNNNAGTYVSNEEINIYTRSSTTETTWTLRQTFSNGALPSAGDRDHIYSDVEISPSGKHIVLFSDEIDSGGDDKKGSFVVLTNETLAGGNYSWEVSLVRAMGGIVGVDYYASHSLKFGAYDDLFYTFSRPDESGASDGYDADSVISCNKYSLSSWTKYDYNGLIEKYIPYSGAMLGSYPDHFLVKDNPVGAAGEVTFMFLQQNWGYSEGAIVSVRGKYRDLEGKAGLDLSFVEDSEIVEAVAHDNADVNLFRRHPVASVTRVHDEGVNIAASSSALILDKATGDLFVTALTAAAGGITNRGTIAAYIPARDEDSVNGFSNVEYFIRGNYGTADSPTPYLFTVPVPAGVDRMSVIAVGAGGGSAKTHSSYAGGGAGGGSLLWANDIAISSSDVVQIGVASSATGYSQGLKGGAELWINGVRVLLAYPGYTAFNRTSSGAGFTPQFITSTVVNARGLEWSSGSTYKVNMGGYGGNGQSTTSNLQGGGGGGAGGYNGAGGRGCDTDDNPTQTVIAGSGGGSGGGKSQNGYGVAANGIGSDGLNTHGSRNNLLSSNTYSGNSMNLGGAYGAGAEGRDRAEVTGNRPGGAGFIRLMFGHGYKVGGSTTYAGTSPLVRNFESTY